MNTYAEKALIKKILKKTKGILDISCWETGGGEMVIQACTNSIHFPFSSCTGKTIHATLQDLAKLVKA